MNTVKREEVHTFIKELPKGSIFTVIFRKRTTGELREMNCRQGVKKHLKGGEAKYSFESKGLVSVFDIQNKGYRCFPLDALRQIKTGGKTYIVD